MSPAPIEHALQEYAHTPTLERVTKVMDEGGVLNVGGRFEYFTAAPKWVFVLMSRGIQVAIGAWCRSDTIAARATIERLLNEKPTPTE